MATKLKRPPLDEIGQSKLLARIEERFSQLEEKLDELEAKISDNDDINSDTSTLPRKPR